MDFKTVNDALILAEQIKLSINKARCISDTMFTDFYICDELKTEQAKANTMINYKFAYLEHCIVNDYLAELQKDITALVTMIDNIPADTTYEKDGDINE